MSENTIQVPAPARNYSAFDAELTHQALNVRLFVRLLGWMKPYLITLFVSIAFVVVAALAQVLMPILTSVVIIDTILVPTAIANDAQDYGLLALVGWIQSTFAFEALTAAGLVYVVVLVGQSLLSFAHQLTLYSCSLKALRDLRIDLFAALERKPASFFDHVGVGRVMTRVTNDVENLFQLLTGFGGLAGEFVPFFVALFAMLAISGSLTGVVLVALPVAVIATILFRIAMRKIFRFIRDSVSALNQYMQEDLVGIDVVQLSGRENQNIEEYGALNRANRGYEFRAINYEVLYDTFNMSLGSVVTGGIVWFGGGQVIQQDISLGSMILFTSLVQMMIMPIVSLGQQFNVLFRSMASGERIFQALDWDEQLHEPDEPTLVEGRLRGKVEFRHAHFGYYEGEEILKDVSFSIAPGEKLAIVGPTGSGKSTIIRLLVRFYDIDDNMVFVDDVDVNKLHSRDLRERVGVVLQDFHIFSGTVRDNITLNNPDITPERAEWAARSVNADGFIRELADGYDTQLAERGQNLSQGQRQLLAFARVLAADPEILVLDEATANIDTSTELVIQDAVAKLTEGRTSIVVAHRLQTIQECDRILVLHHGVVEELGTHEELIAQRGIYYTLHELQFQDADVAREVTREDEGSEGRTTDPRWAEVPDDPPDTPDGM